MPGKTVSLPRVSEAARKYVQEVLDYGFHNASSIGINARLEKEFAEKFGVRYGILHANGTATMHSALLAAGVGVGDEVIVPGLTMASTALVALYVNAVPVFADIDPDTFTISLKDIKNKLSPRTKAIIPVSIYGLAPDLDSIMELANQHALTVIEDNAQCFLGYYKDRIVGSIGHFSSFSFQGSKHMTCGDGGILISDNEELANRARKAAVLGYAGLTAVPGQGAIPEELRCHPTAVRHTDFGYNYRLPEIAAAVALGELERLDDLVCLRRENAGYFDEVVRDCDWIIPQKVPEGYVHSYFTYAAQMASEGPDWSEFRKKFIELGGDGFYGSWLPVYKEPVFSELHERVQRNPERYPQFSGRIPDYSKVTCKVLESIQPRMIQLKTNNYDLAQARRQADVLARNIRCFS